MTNSDVNHTEPTPAAEPRLAADPRPAFAECADVARSVVAELTEADADRPTPTDMSVAELLPHLVMAMRRIAASGHNTPIDQWPLSADDVTMANAATALDQALDDTINAWADDATLTETRPLPWDPSPAGNETLAVYVNELLCHTWDLAVAIGARPTWSNDTIEVALAVMRKQLPMADRTPIWQALADHHGIEPEETTAFANAVPVPADAAPLDQLLAWGGRNPALMAGPQTSL